MAGPIDALSAGVQVSVQWTAQDNISALSPVIKTDTLNKLISYTTGAAVAGGANQVRGSLLSIAGAGNTTIDLLAAFTNVVNLANATFARIKALLIRLLSVADDATNGTACSYITVGNAAMNAFTGVAGNPGWLATAASQIQIPNGGVVLFGTGNANGVVVDATHKDLLITNNDASVAAAVLLAAIGADA